MTTGHIDRKMLKEALAVCKPESFNCHRSRASRKPLISKKNIKARESRKKNVYWTNGSKTCLIKPGVSNSSSYWDTLVS
uniref:Uncharacterized protein n=1 Tax=Fundulus heteroclitus TaxID=8078 RepID=A0A3Q2PJE0_FUNHE